MKKYASAEIWRRADVSDTDLEQIGELAGRKMALAGLHSAPRMHILGGAAKPRGMRRLMWWLKYLSKP